MGHRVEGDGAAVARVGEAAVPGEAALDLVGGHPDPVAAADVAEQAAELAGPAGARIEEEEGVAELVPDHRQQIERGGALRGGEHPGGRPVGGDHAAVDVDRARVLLDHARAVRRPDEREPGRDAEAAQLGAGPGDRRVGGGPADPGAVGGQDRRAGEPQPVDQRGVPGCGHVDRMYLR
jgi:hypothetical protein